MDKNKILIIEDEAAIRELLCMNLEAVGYETDTACDGMQAELKIEEDRGGYDLALVDVMLPGRDGFDLIGGLNKKETLHLPTNLYLCAILFSQQREEKMV